LFGFNFLSLEGLFCLQIVQALNEFEFLVFRCFGLFFPVFQKGGFFGQLRLERIEFVFFLSKDEVEHGLKFEKVFGARFGSDLFVSLDD
jgi:hypothetical protein